MDRVHCQNLDQALCRRSGPKNVGLHFSKSDHTTSDISIQVLECIREEPTQHWPP